MGGETASYEHVAWAVKQMALAQPKVVTFTSGDHFILWNRAEETKREILELIEVGVE